jgi:urease accessory protein
LELALLHPPGGLVEGDRLDLEINLNPGANALLTTPAAQKLYRARDWQTQRVAIKVNGGTLAYLPQETIVFAGAKGRLTLEAEVASDSRFLGWDIISLGGPESLATGSLVKEMEITRNGDLLFKERLSWSLPEDLALLKSPLGLAGRKVAGVFWALGRADSNEAALLERAAEETLKEAPFSLWSGVTVKEGLLLARRLGSSPEKARAFLEIVWRRVTELWGGRVYRPRLWAT